MGYHSSASSQGRVVMSDAHCRNADSLLHGLVAIFTEQEARGGDTGDGRFARRRCGVLRRWCQADATRSHIHKKQSANKSLVIVAAYTSTTIIPRSDYRHEFIDIKLWSASSLAATLGAPLSQHLMRSNFLLWKAFIILAFRGANVMGLLDGSDRAPAKTIEIEDSNKKKIQVEVWIASDQQVLRFLMNSLSPEILSHILGMDTIADVWTAFNAKMNGFSFELPSLGKSTEEDELLGYLLHGLDQVDYNALITSVNGNPGTSLDDFYEQLCSYDMRNGVEENGSFIFSANLARRGSDGNHAIMANGPAITEGNHVRSMTKLTTLRKAVPAALTGIGPECHDLRSEHVIDS
ncbi:hypothetical protein QYE76_036344 [Lolium multiflorum]|uniref:Uncharacterized protein n=1 Tax=Lolium multiflorum TaxID=4521 RepID=A0AAD8R2F5_LOLMU|nr:hypothetical protein QYE76_036344 [Lolium multiflorum]